MTIGKRLPASTRRNADALTDSPPASGIAGQDRLGAAAWLVNMAIGLVVTAAVVAAGDGLRTGAAPSEKALRIVRTLGLSDIALIPAGRWERGVVLGGPIIDGRFQPTLPRQDPGRVRFLENERLLGPTVLPP